MSPPDTSAPGAAPPPELALMQSPAARAVRKLPTIFARRVVLLAVFLVLASAVGVTMATSLGTLSYKLRSKLVYTPLPSAVELREVYRAPDLKTLLTFVKTPGTLGRLSEEFRVEVPVRLLDKLISVENPTQTDTVMLSLEWHDAAEGAAILDRLMTLYSQEVASMRRKKLHGYVADLEQAVLQARRRRDATYDALRRFNARLGVEDYRTAASTVSKQVEDLEFQLGRLEIEEKSTHKLIEDTHTRKRDGQRQAAEEARKEAEQAAQTESITEIRQRQNRISEKRRDEKAKLQTLAEIESKKAELKRVRELYRKHYASVTEVETLQTQLRVLYAKVVETPEIKALTEEIQDLDKAVIPTKENKKPSNPIITQLLTAELQHEQDLLSIEVRIETIRTKIVIARRKLEQFIKERQEGEALQQEVEDLARQVSLVESQRAAFERLLAYEPHEFTIAAGASSALEVPSSNRKKMAVLGFLPTFLLLAGPLLMWDLWNARRPDIGLLLMQHGLPDLSPPLPGGVLRKTSFDARTRRRWCDHVALRLQQMAPRVGSTILVSHHETRVADADLWADVAASLASREERVLLLMGSTADSAQAMFADALTTPEVARRPDRDPVDTVGGRGLYDYLTGEDGSDTERLIVRTPIVNVDLLPAGGGVLTTSTLASCRLDALIETVRQRYTTILLIGPDFADSITVEVLSRLADGIVISCQENSPFSADEVHCVESLIDLGAPLWGVTIRPDAAIPTEQNGLPDRVARPLAAPRPSASTLAGDAPVETRMERRGTDETNRPTEADMKALGARPRATEDFAAVGGQPATETVVASREDFAAIEPPFKNDAVATIAEDA